MNVRFVNNDGCGYSNRLDVREGITLDAFFERHFPGGDPKKYTVKVNGVTPLQTQILKEGDTVSITPQKIEGGA